MRTQTLTKFGLLGSLYVAQYMPAWFLYHALPVFMRQQGASLEAIGILPALALPITLRFLAGFLIAPLGRKRSLVLFSTLWMIGIATYLLPTFGITNLPILYLTAISVGITGGMIAAIDLTVCMDKSQLETAGTDYSVQTSIGVFGSISGSILGGFVAEASGYRGVFMVSVAIALLCVVIIAKFFPNHQPSRTQSHYS